MASPILITIDAYKGQLMSDDPEDIEYLPVKPFDVGATFFCLGAPAHWEVMSAAERRDVDTFNDREYRIDYATVADAVIAASRRYPSVPILLLNEPIGHFPKSDQLDRTPDSDAVEAVLRALLKQRRAGQARAVQDNR